MTAVFVHGVPETQAVWDDLRESLGEDSVALSLPGFGAAVPAGFDGTKDAYADWLVRELGRVEGPVDLVGHDWGALLSLRVVTTRAVPLRSWVVDIANCFDPGYAWHGAALRWQQPGVGEDAMAAWRAPDETGVPSVRKGLVALGVPDAKAVEVAAAMNETMGAAILGLYRSAVPNVWADWGDDVQRPQVPGLVVLAGEDPFNDPVAATRVAERLGARTARLDGLSHDWMAQDPAAALDVLRGFWGDLG